MVKSCIILSIIFFLVSCTIFEKNGTGNSGAISGHISPEDVSLRIVAKTAGTEYKNKKNIKSEVTLSKGGNFTLKNLPSGKYDLLFFLSEKSKKKYIASRWSEVLVNPGKTTSGINYRLTPQGSQYLIDEILITFKGHVSIEEAKNIIHSAGCIIKSAPYNQSKFTTYTIDIPDDKDIHDMIHMFKQKKDVKHAEPNMIITMNQG